MDTPEARAYHLKRLHDRMKMNAFEKAKDTYHHRNVEAKKRYQEIRQAELAKPVQVEEPKEKPKKSGPDAVFDVRVYLPDGEIAFVITKPAIYANVPRAKVNQNELRKAVAHGLTALLGAVK